MFLRTGQRQKMLTLTPTKIRRRLTGGLNAVPSEM